MSTQGISYPKNEHALAHAVMTELEKQGIDYDIWDPEPMLNPDSNNPIEIECLSSDNFNKLCTITAKQRKLYEQGKQKNQEAEGATGS